MEGLDAAEIPLSLVAGGTETKRIDPEYFNRAALLAQRRLQDAHRLGNLVENGYRVVYETTEAIDRDEGIKSGLPFFLQATDISTPFINPESMICVQEKDWQRYPKGRIQPGELLIEVKGKAEKIAIVPDDFPKKTLVTGTCFKLTTKEPDDRYLLAAFLTCKYGQALKERLKTNLLVSYLAKDDLYSLPVPQVSIELRSEIRIAFEHCFAANSRAKNLQHEAEQTLLRALGLENWQPPEPLTYTRRASEALAAERLDSDYFAPRVAELLNKLSEAGLTLGAVAPVRHERFAPGKQGEFDYIEIGNVRADGTADAERLPQSEAPSRAAQTVRAGDVLTSSVRPIRRLSALVTPEQDGYVCSSGFVVLQPRDVPAEVLLTYLRLPVVCELMDLHTSASLYPAISETDLLALPFHPIAKDAEKKIVRAVQSAHAARRQAHALLDAAKRAVEIAIENSEADALRYLKEI